MMPDSLPLIKLEELFIQYDEDLEKKYFLNILMEKAKTDLDKFLENKKILSFYDFFPIFKYSTLGLVFLHMKAIAHRDIKPANFLQMQSGKFVLIDYGIGINLENDNNYNEDGFSY